AMMEDLDTTLAAIRELRGAGIEVMIDDFGTGYSSLGYLSQLPITGLKIDRSFIRDIDKGGQDYIVTDAIVRLAKALGLRTVAEGIEGVDTLNLLADLGCDSGQGYHFARPMPGEEIARRFLTASTV
ncbi:MAG: EAL domain-containing protein, partial [Alphaproteobacteria bacterium]|nr:EAL domain-containing protein [Alphaproteobacteria bacterium]